MDLGKLVAALFVEEFPCPFSKGSGAEPERVPRRRKVGYAASAFGCHAFVMMRQKHQGHTTT